MATKHVLVNSKADPSNSDENLIKSNSPSSDLSTQSTTSATSKTDSPLGYAERIETIDLDKLVRQSAAPIKRGRGRPKKNPEALAASTTQPEQVAATAPVFNLPPEVFRPILKMPFTASAVLTGCDGLRVEDKDIDDLLPAFKAILDKYAPMMTGEYGAEIAFATGMLGLASAKLKIYNEWKVEEHRRNIERQNLAAVRV